MKKVILVGYMGSGKSVISDKLSQKINIQAAELDKLIEENAKKSIKNIFEDKGELYFRKLENKIFKEIIESKEDVIISTGGGTPCYYNNHELLNGDERISIYLKASIDTLYDRLKKEFESRPIIANLELEEAKEFIAKHLFERSYFYNQATYVVTVDNKSVDEIVAEITTLLS